MSINLTFDTLVRSLHIAEQGDDSIQFLVLVCQIVSADLVQSFDDIPDDRDSYARDRSDSGDSLPMFKYRGPHYSSPGRFGNVPKNLPRRGSGALRPFLISGGRAAAFTAPITLPVPGGSSRLWMTARAPSESPATSFSAAILASSRSNAWSAIRF